MDERDLKVLTRDYWTEFNNPDETEERLELYIDQLLPHEMKWASEHPVTSDQPRLPQIANPKLLVILVGFSVEPLLQSVWAYAPEKILLLHNKQYGDPADGGRRGADFASMVERLIQKAAIKKPLSIRPQVDCQEVTAAEPVAVFHKLLEEIKTTEKVIIDITGAKKSMMAGAFLYAAYANVDVSYVDFDDEAFDPEYRRPYGYACRIGRLNNPYQAFALRDWERIRELYNGYNFRAAAKLLDTLVSQNTIKSSDIIRDYLAEMNEPVRRLRLLLDCYELWNSGEFNRAKIEADKITTQGWNSKFPDAVTQLGGNWFDIDKGKFINEPRDFYDNTNRFQIYVYDELKRVERLYAYDEDYRSTFLRAAGLNEVLMVARWISQYTNQVEKKRVLGLFDQATPNTSSLFRQLMRLEGQKAEVKWRYKGSEENLPVVIQAKMQRWWKTTKFFNNDNGWEDFINTRNKLAHTYFSVPENLALDAITFTRANFEDFLCGKSIDSLGFCAETLSWSEVCQHCGFDNWLPPNLREDQ